MDSKPANPLAKHFRQPAIYLKLPSGGQYWPEGSINLPVNGEIAIYPMTTRDEITLRTPDALMNGAGVVSVIQSCCPEIVDAWRMPSIDVDAVIIAIRIASYGPAMTFTSRCPECNEVHDYALQLQNVLENIRMPDYNSTLTVENLKIKFTPQPYFDFNEVNQATFEEQKLLQSIEATDMDPDMRSAQINAQLSKILMHGVNRLASSIQYIETEDGTQVTDKAFMREFFENTNSAVIKQIQERLAEINEQGAIKPLHVNCEACTKPFDIQVTFDYASFFDKGFWH